MSEANRLQTVDDLLGYSRAIEEEAAERYAELSDMMTVHNNRDLAEFFKRMAEVEQKHLDHVKYLQNPARSRDFHGVDLGGREAPDWNEFHYLHMPYHAINIALRFEQRAADFFADLSRRADVANDVRELAAELAEEEAGHVRELTELLKRYPEPAEDWDYDPDPVGEQ